MNTDQDATSATHSMPTPYRRRAGWRLLTWLAPLALIVPVLKAAGQGTILLNNRIAGTSFNQTGHVWAPSTTSPGLSLIGLGSNDNPSGTTPFGSASGMALIGAVGSGGQYGCRTTLAQLIGALGQNMPESALVPLDGVTTFRTGVALGCVAAIQSTFTNNPASLDAPWATVEMVAWDNSSGLYPTWAQASVAWAQGLIAAGHSAAFNVANISGPLNPVPSLTSAGTISGLSFNLYPKNSSSLPLVAALPATGVTFTNATLNGNVNPNGLPTVAWFQWGTNTSYGNLTAATDMGSGTNALPLSVPLAGLVPGTIYYFRVAATNSPYTVYSSDQSFTALGRPEVWTFPATAVTSNSAVLNGAISPNGYPTAAWFQWGTTTNYGNLTSVTAMGSGSNALPLSVPLQGLPTGFTYHFRVAATNSFHAVYGSDQNFTIPGVGSGPVTWPVNGHQYEFVSWAGISWANAKAAVPAGWYLATLTSQAENQWVYDNVVVPNNHAEVWLGAFAPAGRNPPSAGWQWVTGEPWNYTAWSPGEPNNTTETGLTINRYGTSGWNDEYDCCLALIGGYVIERNSVPCGGPVVLHPPLTQTAEIGSTVCFGVTVSNIPPWPGYQWYWDGTNALANATNAYLCLADAQPSLSGTTYAVAVTNNCGAVTSLPATLSVITPVVRKAVPAIYLTGDVASTLHLSYADTPGPGAYWQELDAVMLTASPQFYPDLTDPLPPYRFYRAWQTNVPSTQPELQMSFATELTLTGAMGSNLRVDYINQFGPTDAWITLDTITLTNTTQAYFDFTMFRQPARLYRLVPVP